MLRREAEVLMLLELLDVRDDEIATIGRQTSGSVVVSFGVVRIKVRGQKWGFDGGMERSITAITWPGRAET
jgi:hypothetical protein